MHRSVTEVSHELREELLKRSVAERLELVQELWDSIAADCEREPYPLTDEQRQDLERRLADAEADPAGGAPWQAPPVSAFFPSPPGPCVRSSIGSYRAPTSK